MYFVESAPGPVEDQNSNSSVSFLNLGIGFFIMPTQFSQKFRRQGRSSIINRRLRCGGLETPATAGLETGATSSRRM